jgi:hypothetical protein
MRLCMILGEELEKVFQSVHEPGWPYWANFRLLGDCFLGQFYEKYSSRQKCRLLFSKIKVIYILFMARNGIGYVLSVFFTNSSGRPATNLGMLQRLAAIEGILQTNLIFTGKKYFWSTSNLRPYSRRNTYQGSMLWFCKCFFLPKSQFDAQHVCRLVEQFIQVKNNIAFSENCKFFLWILRRWPLGWKCWFCTL